MLGDVEMGNDHLADIGTTAVTDDRIESGEIDIPGDQVESHLKMPES